MKKLIAFLSATLMLVAVAAPALAGSPCGQCKLPKQGICCPSVEISNDNMAVVTTGATSYSNSGGNTQTNTGMSLGSSNSIVAGDSYSTALSASQVNSNTNTVRTWNSVGGVEVRNGNGAFVVTDAFADSNSGRNSQTNTGFSCGTNTIRTGLSNSYSDSLSIVNSNTNTVRSWGTWVMPR